MSAKDMIIRGMDNGNYTLTALQNLLATGLDNMVADERIDFTIEDKNELVPIIENKIQELTV